MPGIEDAMREQAAKARDLADESSKRKQESMENLREFRDLMVSRDVPQDQTYSLEYSSVWVPEKRALFGKPVAAHNLFTFEFQHALTGWVLRGADLDWGMKGQLLTDDLHIFDIAEPHRTPGDSRINYVGLRESDLRKSAYFSGRYVLVLGDENQPALSGWHGPRSVDELATAAGKYLR